METLKLILLATGLGILGIIGLALVMVALSIPIWGAIWITGEVIEKLWQ